MIADEQQLGDHEVKPFHATDEQDAQRVDQEQPIKSSTEDDEDDADEDDEDDDAESINEPPLHPVPSLQEAFEESIADAADGDDHDQLMAHLNPNAEARRKELLDLAEYDDSLIARWNLKPDAVNHPLVKLMAQIIFGLHLLHQSQAKSDAEVVKILQNHVDEIDGFLERTTEDFRVAYQDIRERITHLQLPMTHLEVFDVMLDDRKFRSQLIDGNARIEQIIDRSAAAMNASLFDIRNGLVATVQLAEYLGSIQTSWPRDSSEQAAILVAMRGNQEGWAACLRELQTKAGELREALVQLGTVIGEMAKLTAAASRRNHPTLRSATSPRHDQTSASPRSFASPGSYHSPSPRSPPQFHRRKVSVQEANKPLPHDPDTFKAAVRATITRPPPRTSLEDSWPSPQNQKSQIRPKDSFSPGTPPHRQPSAVTSPRTGQYNRHESEMSPETLAGVPRQVSVFPSARSPPIGDPHTAQHFQSPRQVSPNPVDVLSDDTLPVSASPQGSLRFVDLNIRSPGGLPPQPDLYWPVSNFESPGKKTTPGIKSIKKLFGRKKEELYI